MRILPARKQSQLSSRRRYERDRIVQNKANFEALPVLPNEPNFRPSRTPSFHYSIIPGFQPPVCVGRDRSTVRERRLRCLGQGPIFIVHPSQ